MTIVVINDLVPAITDEIVKDIIDSEYMSSTAFRIVHAKKM